MFLVHDNLIFLNKLDILVAECVGWTRPEPHPNYEFETWSHVDLALFAKADLILVRRLNLLIRLFICCDENSLKQVII
jgi:hypothetical protein